MEATSSEVAWDSPTASLKDVVRKLQHGDAHVQLVSKQLKEVPGHAQVKDWRIDSEGLLRFKDAIYVPASTAVKQELL